MRPVMETPPAAPAPQRLLLSQWPTPAGMALLICDETGALRVFDWEGYDGRMRRLLARHYGPVEPETGATPPDLSQALDAYFGGDLTAIDAIRVATNGTPFQRRVWAGLRLIPAGETRSYGQLAAMIGAPPTAVRAVGLANGANPIGVVVPCHRVIGADGSLTGYAGGLSRKRWLLTHEGAGFSDKPKRGDKNAGEALSALPLFAMLGEPG